MRAGTPGFVGHRLSEAREARGLTATALADLLGVSKQSVSQYEGDVYSPAPEVMRRISDVLKLPIHYFLKRREPEEDEGIIFFRSTSSTTKIARLRAKQRYRWLREIVAYLQGYVKFPTVNYPNFHPPADPTLISDQLIEQYATQTRRFWNLGDGPISNVTWLLENNGAVIARYELMADELDAFSQWGQPGNTPFIVLGADKASSARSRFDAAHELGHLILHRNVPKTLFNQKAVFALLEAQAHRFAKPFLMPEETFSDDFFSPSVDALRSLKSKWKVSIQAMIMRASELKLITDDQENRLWINIGRRGWKKKEPLDDELPLEQPRFLRRSFELLLENKIIISNEMLYHISLESEDVEELAGLPRGYLANYASPIELLRLPSTEAEPQAELKEQRILQFPTG